MRARTPRMVRRSGTYAILILVAAVFTTPLLWLVDSTLKSTGQLAAFPVQWLPHSLDLDNYRQAVSEIPFLAYARNSLTIALLYAVLTTLSSAFIGFGFARLRGRGKKAMFGVVLATMMMPHVVTLIPTYLIFAKVHLLDTYWPWVLWGAGGSAFLIFMFRQFFSGLPSEIEEAAIVDGCGYFRIFWKVFLPQARPMLATGLILSFTWNWGDFLTPDLLLSMDRTTLGVALANGYQDPSGAPQPNLQAAGATLYVIPVIVLFLVAQRAYTANSATSGLK